MIWTPKNVRRWIVFLTTLSVCLLSSPASAADDVELEHEATPLAKDQPAPFAGTLLPPWLALELADDSCPAKRQADQVAAGRLLGVRVDEQKALRSSAARAAAERERLLRDELDRQTAFYRQPIFVAIVSMAVTIGIVVATGYVLGAIAHPVTP